MDNLSCHRTNMALRVIRSDDIGKEAIQEQLKVIKLKNVKSTLEMKNICWRWRARDALRLRSRASGMHPDEPHIRAGVSGWLALEVDPYRRKHRKRLAVKMAPGKLSRRKPYGSMVLSQNFGALVARTDGTGPFSVCLRHAFHSDRTDTA